MFISRLDVDDTTMTAVRSGTPDIRAERGTVRDTLKRRTVVQAMATTWRLWRERTAARRELATLDEHILRDIGIPREMVDYELSKPWWQPLRDWRDVRYTDMS